MSTSRLLGPLRREEDTCLFRLSMPKSSRFLLWRRKGGINHIFIENSPEQGAVERIWLASRHSIFGEPLTSTAPADATANFAAGQGGFSNLGTQGARMHCTWGEFGQVQVPLQHTGLEFRNCSCAAGSVDVRRIPSQIPIKEVFLG